MERLCRRPKITSTNAATVRAVFKKETRKVLPIPEFIDNYNYNIGGVDIADQLRSYYSTQQPSRRNWFQLFYWLLDTSLVNVYRIQPTMNPNRHLQSEHFNFRSTVADQLILDGIRLSEQLPLPTTPSPYSFSSSYVPNLPVPKVTYISHARDSTGPFPSKNLTQPTPVSFPLPGTHRLEQRPTRTLCILCHWQRSQVLLAVAKVKSVNLGCRECNVTLCQDCIFLFHNIHRVPDHQDTSNHGT